MEDELLPPPPKKVSNKVEEDFLLPPPPKKKLIDTPNLLDIGQPFTSGVQTPLVKPSPLVSNLKSTSETKPTTKQVNPFTANKSQLENVYGKEIDFSKEKPLERTNLYKSAISNIQKRTSENLLQAEELRQQGDEEGMRQVLAQIEADQQKVKTLNKGIEGQKLIAESMGYNSLGERAKRGLDMVLGQVLIAPESADKALSAIESDLYSSIGIDMKGLQEKILKTKSDYEAETGKKMEFPDARLSDDLADIGFKILDKANKEASVGKLGNKYSSTSELIKSGDIGEITKQGVGVFLESLPTSLAMAASPISAATIGAGMVGSEMHEAEQEGQKVDSKVVLSGTIKAALEFATENMFGAGRVTKELIQSIGKEAAEKVVKESIEKVVKEGFAKKYGKAISEEVLGEVTNQIGSNAVDKYINGKNVKLTEGIEDAAFAAIFSSGIQTTPTLLAQRYVDKKAVAAAQEKKAQAAKLVEEAAAQPTEVAQAAIEEKAHQLDLEADKEIDKHIEIAKKATDEDLVKIDELDNAIDELNVSLENNQNPEINSILEEKLVSLEANREKVIKEVENRKNEPTKETETPITPSSSPSSEVSAPNNVEELIINTENDKENTSRLQSNERKGQEPIETKPNETTSGEKVETSGVLQAPKEEVVKETAKKLELDNKNYDELEAAYNKLSNSKNKDVRILSNMIENVQEKKERNSVLDIPLEKVGDTIDKILKQDTYFIEKREAREAKEVATKYLGEVSKSEAKKDFKEAFFGNPDTWIADSLKMRESVRVFKEQGGTFKELLSSVQKEFEQDGFTEQDAAMVIKNKLNSLTKKDFRQDQLAEAYHAAKKDGSNPELVKAVEELLGTTKTPQSGIKSTETNQIISDKIQKEPTKTNETEKTEISKAEPSSETKSPTSSKGKEKVTPTYIKQTEGGRNIIQTEDLKTNFPVFYERVVKKFSNTAWDSSDIRDAISYLIANKPKFKNGINQLISAQIEAEQLLLELGQDADFISKEQLLEKINKNENYSKEQKEVFANIVNRLKGDKFFNFTNKNIETDNGYLFSDNLLKAKDADAFVHEIGHWGFYNLLSSEERTKYLEYVRDRFYGTNNKMSDDLAIKRENKILDKILQSNSEDNFSEYFAEQFRQYIIDGLAPKEVESIFESFKKYLIEIVKLFKEKGYNKDLKPFFDKIITEQGNKNSELKEKVNPTTQKAVEQILNKEVNDKGELPNSNTTRKNKRETALKEVTENLDAKDKVAVEHIVKNLDLIRQKLLDARLIESIDCKWAKK